MMLSGMAQLGVLILRAGNLRGGMELSEQIPMKYYNFHAVTPDQLFSESYVIQLNKV